MTSFPDPSTYQGQRWHTTTGHVYEKCFVVYKDEYPPKKHWFWREIPVVREGEQKSESFIPDQEHMQEVLEVNGWARAYFFRAHGWDYDGFRYAFVGQDREEIVRLTKSDWLSLEEAYEQQMHHWEE